jgi:hypothetical protein
LDFADQAGDFLGGVAGAFGKFANFVGDDGEAVATSSNRCCGAVLAGRDKAVTERSKSIR